jgi:DNA-binding transcriptional ArsR family regulator
MTAKEVILICGAMASDKRLQILEWLENPMAHFPPQRDGDLEKDGVCGVSIANKLDVSQPTTSRHMKILSDAGLIRAKSQKGWTFYRLDPMGMALANEAVSARLGSQDAAPGTADAESTL